MHTIIHSTLQSGVYTLFVGLSVQPKYKPSIPITGPDQDGFGPNKDIFQLDRPVKFHMTKTSGNQFLYRLQQKSMKTGYRRCSFSCDGVNNVKFL